MESDEVFQNKFSTAKFWNKINFNWRSAGKRLIEIAAELYYSMQDSDTPKWAKAVILGALGYFVTPIDTIPDFTPMIGFSDDLGVMLSALAVVAIHIKSEHKQKAKELSSRFF